MITVGLDTSMTSSGVCILKDGVIEQIKVIKTKPDKFKDEIVRMMYIRDSILGSIPKDTSLICLEDVYTPFNSKGVGAAMMLSRLAGIIRNGLYESGFAFRLVVPTSLKKFILPKGTSQKDMIVMEVLSQYNVKCEGDDQADAFVLAKIAEAIMSDDRSQLNARQKEVVGVIETSDFYKKGE